jgi:phage protein D
VDGEEIDSAYQVISIDTWSSVNKVPRAQIVLFDGSAAEGDFPISNLSTFLPGARVEIAAGYDDETETIFSGVVVKQGIEITGGAGSRLSVDLADPAIKMTLARKNAAFEDVTDSDLIGKLCGASGVQKDVEATTTKHERIVQFHATDWDLMLTRAEANGLVVTTSAGKVTVKPPDTAQAAVLRVEYGDSILDLQAELDAVDQVSSSAVKSYAWDYSTQALLEAGPGAVSVTEAGNVSADELAQVFSVSIAPRQSGAARQAALRRSFRSPREARQIRGHVRQGSALAETGRPWKRRRRGSPMAPLIVASITASGRRW